MGRSGLGVKGYLQFSIYDEELIADAVHKMLAPRYTKLFYIGKIWRNLGKRPVNIDEDAANGLDQGSPPRHGSKKRDKS
jgi:hypothetical protein